MQSLKKNKTRIQTKKNFFKKGGVGSNTRKSRRLGKRNALYDGSIIDNPKKSKRTLRNSRSSASVAETLAQSPARSPAQSPARSPAQTPARSPARSPAQTQDETPIVQTPEQSPAQSPLAYPSPSPAENPTQNSIENEDFDFDLGNFDDMDNNDVNPASLGNLSEPSDEPSAESSPEPSAEPSANPSAEPSPELSAASSVVNFDGLYNNSDFNGSPSIRSENADVVSNIPYCNCSPLFTDKSVEKIRKNKKFSQFFRGNMEIQTRSSLQKEFRDLTDAERTDIKQELIDFCRSPEDTTGQSTWKESFIEKITTDATEANDILVIRDNNEIRGVMSVSKLNDTHAINYLCFGDNENVAGFMLTVYLLCLNENGFDRGILPVVGGRENKRLLCLGDKYGFVVNENLTARGNATVMEVNLVNANGVRVLKAKIVNTFLEKCRKFQRNELECGARRRSRAANPVAANPVANEENIEDLEEV